jgi:hypothetical protein
MYAALGAVDWNRNSVVGFLQDLLTVFDKDGAILASVRFTTTGENGQVVLRLYEVLSVYTQNPPDETRSADVSCRHVNNGWKAIFSGEPRIFTVDADWNGIHRDSDSIECGICLPFKFFAHDHAVDGVVSIDFGKRKELPEDSWTTPSWKSAHIEFLALATRQFAWAALSNNPRDSLTAEAVDILEGKAVAAWQWFRKKLMEHLKTPKGVELIGLENPTVRLFDSHIPGACVLSEPMAARSKAPKIKDWFFKPSNEKERRKNFEQRQKSFTEHRDNSPESDLTLYGARFSSFKWSKVDPAKKWTCWIVFPLFLGAECVGNIECKVVFAPAAPNNHKLNGQNESHGQDASERTKAHRNRAAWAKHFRELRSVFSRAVEIWYQFVNGNLVLSNPGDALWRVEAKDLGDGQFELEYSWGQWTLDVEEQTD